VVAVPLPLAEAVAEAAVSRRQAVQQILAELMVPAAACVFPVA